MRLQDTSLTNVCSQSGLLQQYCLCLFYDAFLRENCIIEGHIKKYVSLFYKKFYVLGFVMSSVFNRVCRRIYCYSGDPFVSYMWLLQHIIFFSKIIACLSLRHIIS